MIDNWFRWLFLQRMKHHSEFNYQFLTVWDTVLHHPGLLTAAVDSIYQAVAIAGHESRCLAPPPVNWCEMHKVCKRLRSLETGDEVFQSACGCLICMAVCWWRHWMPDGKGHSVYSDRVIVFLRFGWWSLCFGKTALSGLTWFFLLLWWLKHQLALSEVLRGGWCFSTFHATSPTSGCNAWDPNWVLSASAYRGISMSW